MFIFRLYPPRAFRYTASNAYQQQDAQRRTAAAVALQPSLNTSGDPLEHLLSLFAPPDGEELPDPNAGSASRTSNGTAEPTSSSATADTAAVDSADQTTSGTEVFDDRQVSVAEAHVADGTTSAPPTAEDVPPAAEEATPTANRTLELAEEWNGIKAVDENGERISATTPTPATAAAETASAAPVVETEQQQANGDVPTSDEMKTADVPAGTLLHLPRFVLVRSIHGGVRAAQEEPLSSRDFLFTHAAYVQECFGSKMRNSLPLSNACRGLPVAHQSVGAHLAFCCTSYSSVPRLAV